MFMLSLPESRFVRALPSGSRRYFFECLLTMRIRGSLLKTKKQAHETSHEPVLRGSDRIRTYDTPGMNRML